MHAVSTFTLLALAVDAQAIRYVVWTGLVALTCCLLVLARTQWGQSNPLRKCIVLSLLAHLLVGIYATTVQIVTAGPRGGEATSIVLIDGVGDATDGPPEVPASQGNPSDESAAAALPEKDAPRQEPQSPEKTPNQAAAAPPVVAVSQPPKPAAEAAPVPAKPADPHRDRGPVPGERPAASDVAGDVPAPDAAPPEPGNAGSQSPITADAAKPAREPTIALPVSTGPLSNLAENSRPTADRLNGEPEAKAAEHVPQIYALRMARDHVRVAEQNGGSAETEAAVGSALKYLVANQSADGRWNARALGGGRETQQDGRNRQGAGGQADSGITGLCLLSLLAAGHTHLQGAYDQPVRHGLEFLLNVQAADGNLAGNATLYERTYCHGMAAFALSEAYAMTGDDRLQPAVRAAIQYTLAAQDRRTGGWRYQPGDPGDMSQFGWQAMALKSAQLGGIKLPDESRDLMRRFLKTVSTGRQGGLAGYRPGHPASRAMTAEHLVCLQFMGLASDDPIAREAGEFLLKELPGHGDVNVYYWYYGTLGMFQLQGEYWRRWNAALQAELLATQRRGGKLTGSWDPDSVWGAYGGRAYSTALSTLCLEVYYRFLPLHAAHAEPQPRE